MENKLIPTSLPISKQFSNWLKMLETPRAAIHNSNPRALFNTYINFLMQHVAIELPYKHYGFVRWNDTNKNPALRLMTYSPCVGPIYGSFLRMVTHDNNKYSIIVPYEFTHDGPRYLVQRRELALSLCELSTITERIVSHVFERWKQLEIRYRQQVA